MAWWRRLPAPVRVGAALASVVALASGALSWDALVWAAGELHIDARLRPLFPLVVDGTIGVATVGAFALRRASLRVRAYVWAMLVCAIGCSVLANGAHSADGNALHAAGGTLPSAGLAVTLHLLVVLARHVQRAPVASRRRARARTTKGARVVHNGKEVHPGHARRLRGQEHALETANVA